MIATIPEDSGEPVRTVGDLIRDLSIYDPSLPIGFATGEAETVVVLSIYIAREPGDGRVWIDLGPELDQGSRP